MLALGWRVELIYLALPSAEMSRLRVAERVKHGGHDIAAADIARRFPRSLHNLFHRFAPLVSQTHCFMNDRAAPHLVFHQTGAVRSVVNAELFEFLSQEAQP